MPHPVDAADAIRLGPIIVQTDTVFGLACRPETAHIEAVFEAKQRPLQRNLPVIIGEVGQLADLGVQGSPAAEALAAAFWPGALTLAYGFDPGRRRPDWLDGRDEVAVRIPALPALRDIARAAGPFLMTSANRHGRPEVRSADEAAEVFGTAFPVFTWPDAVAAGAASTLVNVAVDPPVVEREGAISLAAIRAACPTAHPRPTQESA